MDELLMKQDLAEFFIQEYDEWLFSMEEHYKDCDNFMNCDCCRRKDHV